ncbi:hypothetical protein [Halobacteriovorax sp.]|uniref:hypothetical protein n=1 Tax=Halobacteriovorax sp. TaxID=2020862 RepID=UPI003AF22D09
MRKPCLKSVIHLVFCTVVYLTASSAFASNFVVKNKTKKAVITGDVPKDWRFKENILGFPYVLMSKKHASGHRSIISFTPTKIKSKSLDRQMIKSQVDDYKKGRLSWVEKYEGESVKFLKFRENSIPKISSFSVGHQYIVSKKHFEEKSIYANCSGEVFHIKYLMNMTDEKSDRQIINSVLQSLSCRRGGES